MKQVTEDPAAGRVDLQALYAPIQDGLARVEEMLGAEFSSQDAFVDRLARHGFRLGGKRLRPALVLLAGKATGEVGHAHFVLGAVMEMIHTATLLHDDVLDEATLRRHLDTVNARWNNEASILLGDYVLARALEKVGQLDSPYACRVIGQAAKVVVEGELRQVQWRGNFELPEDDYLDICADKTAELTACCCRLGAHYAGANPPAEERLTQFGRLLGVAFQIADDLLDVLGSEDQTGKSMGTDLVKQKATLPLIRLLGESRAADRDQILEILRRADNHRGEALRPWYQQSGALEYAQGKAREYAARAAAELGDLPDTPARRALVGLTAYVTARRE